MGDVNTLLPAGNTCLHGEDGLVHLDLCSLITVIHELKLHVDVSVCLNWNKHIIRIA